VIPNFWDPGSARLLEHLGFRALASSSAGFAWSVRRRATWPSAKAALMSHLTAVCQCDFDAGERGSAERFRQRSGRCGGDTCCRPRRRASWAARSRTPRAAAAIPCIRWSWRRSASVNAAVAAKSLNFRFTLTARAENYLYGRPDLSDTIRRLQAYQEAGADVLFAPGIKTREDIREIVRSIDRPLNVLVGMTGMDLTVADLQELGVTRISLGGTLARSAYGALLQAATEIQGQGTFGYAAKAASGKELNSIFARP
jgi:2-methylisocitrate lyase-like PEP mutase family enzyme